MALIILYKNLSQNKESENAIYENHPKTNTYYTDLSLTFLSLFIP